MKTIYKYKLKIIDSQIIEMPIGATILTIQTQKETAYLWALVDPDLPKEKRIIETYGTGHEIRNNAENGSYLKYLKSYQLHSELVFHVFERLTNI